MSNKFEIKAKIVKNDFGAVSAATMHDLKSALYVEAESIMTASKRYYVPVDTGSLRNSGTVTPPKESGNTVSITLGYGGASAPYAAIVHEKPKAWGQGRNKYLSQPLNIAVKGMGVRIGKALRISGNRRAI
jgi:hypothetical protein